jgi:multisubunit Na+/H+ antiporter MnhB subunit
LPPAEPRLQQRGVAGLSLAILSLLAMALIPNLQRAAVVAAVALTVAVIALVLAISALSGAKRAGTRRPRGALVGVVLGVIGLLFSGFALLGFLIFGAQLDQYVTCMNAANTVAEQQACQTQLSNSITSRIGGLRGN